MKINKYIGFMMMAATMAAATSCSDFSDYNEVKQDANANAELTLWQNIQQNAQLTNFAKIIQKVGFDDELNTSHFYTVWAPLDGTYDADALLAKDNETLLNQFVKNHIAEYNYVASGTIDERVHTLNQKSYYFSGNGNYTFDGVAVNQANQPCVNGVIHMLGGQAVFYPNLYEYFSLSEGVGLDSLVNMVKKYEYTELDAAKSVVGPIVDGRQTYIDSVMTTYNTLINQTLRAQLDNEDSTYTMLLPTNDAWNKEYSKIGSHYNFISNLRAEYYEQNQSTGAYTLKNQTISSYNTAYLKDSLIRRSLVRNLIYSNNDYYNQWIDGDGVYTDTIRSTSRNKFSDPKTIFAAASQKVKMSNGWGYIVDSLAFKSWETYAPTISVSGLFIEYLNQCSATANSLTSIAVSPSLIDLSGTNGGPTRLSWAEITPTIPRMHRPEISYYLPNVGSGTYNIYCVMVPELEVDENGIYVVSTAETNLPYLIQFDMSYCAANGTLQTASFGQKSNDVTKVDTVFVGQHTFPVSYYGLSDYHPILKLTTNYRFNTKISGGEYDGELYWNHYSRNYRIASVILRPIEQDAYLGKEY